MAKNTQIFAFITFKDAQQVFAASLWSAVNCTGKVVLDLVKDLNYRILAEQSDANLLIANFGNQ